MSPKVADIMTRTVVTATVDTPLPALIDEMLTYGISGVPVVDHERRVLGIVTYADLMCKPAFGGTRRGLLGVLADLFRGRERRWVSKSSGLVAGEIMTTDVQTTLPNETVARGSPTNDPVRGQAPARRRERPPRRHRLALRCTTQNAPQRRRSSSGDRRPVR